MDRTSFLGLSLSPDVKALLPYIAQLDQKIFRKILEYVVEQLKGSEMTNAQVAELQRAAGDAPIPVLLAGIYYIVRAAIRSKVSIENMQTDLTEIRFPQPFTQDIVRVVQKGRAILEEIAEEQRIRFPSLASLKWRVDVVISSSFAARVLTPVILMEVETKGERGFEDRDNKEGGKKTFEIPVEKFHELRYHVAKVLKDMEELEQHPILKIDK